MNLPVQQKTKSEKKTEAATTTAENEKTFLRLCTKALLPAVCFKVEKGPIGLLVIVKV